MSDITSMQESQDRGWSRTSDGEGKYHYFPASGGSLCGKASSEGIDEFTPHTDIDAAGPNDCGLCFRALTARGIL